MEGDDSVARRYSGLSVRAWLAVALHAVHAWFDRVGLAGSDTALFVGHLWRLMPISGSAELGRWESDIPDLEAVALGDPMPIALVERCRSVGVPERELRSVLELTAEIVHSNLYGAVDQPLMLRYLRDLEVVMRRYGLELPDPAPFAASRLDHCHGWGEPLSAEELSRWRAVPLDERRGPPGDVP